MNFYKIFVCPLTSFKKKKAWPRLTALLRLLPHSLTTLYMHAKKFFTILPFLLFSILHSPTLGSFNVYIPMEDVESPSPPPSMVPKEQNLVAQPTGNLDYYETMVIKNNTVTFYVEHSKTLLINGFLRKNHFPEGKDLIELIRKYYMHSSDKPEKNCQSVPLYIGNSRLWADIILKNGKIYEKICMISYLGNQNIPTSKIQIRDLKKLNIDLGIYKGENTIYLYHKKKERWICKLTCRDLLYEVPSWTCSLLLNGAALMSGLKLYQNPTSTQWIVTTSFFSGVVLIMSFMGSITYKIAYDIENKNHIKGWLLLPCCTIFSTKCFFHNLCLLCKPWTKQQNIDYTVCCPVKCEILSNDI